MFELMIYLFPIVVVALLLQKKGLPSHITYFLLGTAMMIAGVEIGFLKDPTFFKEALLNSLPFFIAFDARHLYFRHLKDNAWTIILLAVVNLLLSIAVVGYVSSLYFPYLSMVSFILIGAMVNPTDPIGVMATLKNYKVPHNLLFKLEIESLKNDPIALIVYLICVEILAGKAMGVIDIATFTITLLLISIAIGLVFGYIAYKALKLDDDMIYQISVYLTGIFGSYYISEHTFHSSGIFSVIIVMIFLNEVIEKAQRIIVENLKTSSLNKSQLVNLENHKAVEVVLQFIAMLAVPVLFITFGYMYKPEYLNYIEASFMIFLAFTVTRGLYMRYVYIPLSKRTDKIVNVDSMRWWVILTFGGIRGPLSILMVLGLSILVPNHEHLLILEAITFNCVVLVMAIYTPILIVTFWLHGDKFAHEYELEHKNAEAHNLEH